MEALAALGGLACFSCLLPVLGIGGIILLLKLGVISSYWRRPDHDVIDVEYSLAQEEDFSPPASPSHRPIQPPRRYDPPDQTS